MVVAKRFQVFQRVKAAPDFSGIAVLAWQRPRHVLQLVDECASLLFRPRSRAVEESFGKNRLVEQLLLDLVGWICDDPQSGEDIGDNFVVSECPALRQAARDAGVQESRLEV